MRPSWGLRRTAAAATLSLALLAAACVEESNAPQGSASTGSGVVKIGLIAPFSGTAASIGRNMREGITIAVDELNAQEGVLGQQVEVVARDNEFDAAKSSQIAREMIDQEDVSLIIGPPGTTSYLAIDDLVRQKEVITLPVVTGPQLKDNINPYTFRLMIPDDIQVDVLVDYALDRFSKVALISEDNETGRAISDLAEESMAGSNARPAVVEFFSEDELDLKPVILKAQQAGADAIIIGSHIGPFAARLATAASSLGYSPKFLGLAGLTSYTYPDLARDAAVGTVFVAPPVPVLADDEELPASAENFYETYVDRFFSDGTVSDSGADKVTGAAYLTYDGVHMWARAAEQAGATDPTEVSEVFNGGFDFGPEGSAAGIEWHYDADDHEGFHAQDTWFYEWQRSGDGITFQFLGDAAALIER
jgi:branched-chain amino acid transport system substrate-binding protein